MKLMRLRRWLLIPVLLSVLFYIFLVWPLRNPHPVPQPAQGILLIKDVKIYPSPDAEPIEHGSILVRDGVIASVGPEVLTQGSVEVIQCEHCSVTAGFWNSHVHFTEPKWSNAAWDSAEVLNRQLADMLTSRGFTTVVDLGSNPLSTISLRRRIEASGLMGPAIYTAGPSIFPPNGVPYYLKNSVPFFIVWFSPKPSSPSEASRIVERNIGLGTDVVKLFTGSDVERGHVLPMPEDIARAAADAGHRHGELVFSHASNLAGTKVGINGGVDVLAHAPDTTEGVDDALLASIVERHMAMIPTLKMFATTVTRKEGYIGPIHNVVRRFHALKGELVFGTDVGYMTDYSTEEEFSALAECGLNARDMLRMLTTAPAGRFRVSDRKGSIAVGKAADLTILDGDPDTDISVFSKVRFTIRNGRVLYSRP